MAEFDPARRASYSDTASLRYVARIDLNIKKGNKMQLASEVLPLGVHLPDDLRQCLNHRAVDNRRSLNDEILARLEDSIRSQEDAAFDSKKNVPGRH